MALHRLKPLLSAFEHIDAAIEAAAAAGSCRNEFRSARAHIVQMICDAADGDSEKADGLCALLDEAMAGSLATLRAVPLEKTALASDGLVGAVGALMREHPSERIRGLAGDVVRGWRAGVKADIARARAKLDALPSTPPPHPSQDDTAPAAEFDTTAKKIPEEKPGPKKSGRQSPSAPCPRRGRVSTTENYAPLPITKSTPVVDTTRNAKPSADMGAPTSVRAQPKKTASVIVSSTAEEKKLEATKRKLHERYQEAEEAKRRRTIQVIKPPRAPLGTTGHRQHIAHPGVRARAPASCAAKRMFTQTCSLGMKV